MLICTITIIYYYTYEKQHPKNRELMQSQIAAINPDVLVLLIVHKIPDKLNNICILSNNMNLDCARKQFSKKRNTNLKRVFFHAFYHI